MQTCSFVVQTITPDDADDDADDDAITLRTTTWGGSVIEFTDGDSIDRSDIGQALELAYLAGVRDSGKDVDAARDVFRAAQASGARAQTMTAEVVIAALEASGTISGAAKALDVELHDVKMLIIRHQIMYPRPTVAPVSAPADADPPLAEMFR
jgi:hypothetical protein